MIRRLISVLLIVAIVGFVPVITGCEEPDEIRVERKVEIKDAQVGEPTEVVE